MNKKAKADRCQALLDDPDLNAAFDDLEQRFVDEWKSDDPRMSAEYLDDIRRSVKLLSSIKELLRQAIKDGKLDEFNENQPQILGDLHGRH